MIRTERCRARVARTLLGACLAAFALAEPAVSHGGTYRGPPRPPQPGTPGPGEAGTGGPSTAGGGYRDSDPAAWNQWWALNRDRILASHRRLPSSGSLNPGTPPGSVPAAARPDVGIVRDQVVPALLTILAKEKDNDLVTGALMALAKIGDAPNTPDEESLAHVITPFLKHKHQEVGETAAVALGVLGSRTSAPLLTELLHDTAAGRKLTGKKVDLRTRAFAAYGLGTIARRETGAAVRGFAVHHLITELEASKKASPDIQVACVISLGLIDLRNGLAVPVDDDSPPSPSSSRQALIRFLLDRLGDKKLDPVVRAHIPVALARLEQGADPSVRDAIAAPLLDMLKPRSRTDEIIRHGAIHALGLLGENDEDALDRSIRETLQLVFEEGDRRERNLALVSLARAGGREGEGPAGQARVEVRRLLMETLSRGDNVQKPWAAMSLGILERAGAQAGHPRAEGTLMAVRFAFEKAGNPAEKGALAIALGLMSDHESRPALVEAADGGDESTRGNVATALGLLGAFEASGDLRRLATGANGPGLAREAAIALRLIGDLDAWQALSGLSRSRFLIVSVSRMLAVGYIGHPASVEYLLGALVEKRQSDTVRAYAAVSIGLLCDKDPLPWNTPIAEDMVWWKAPATLFDPAEGRGVIDLY